MNKDDIDRIAVETDLHGMAGRTNQLYAFARAIADLQKENDAKLCDRYAADYAVVGAGAYVYMEEGARSCAAGIRSPETYLDEWLRRQ